MKERVKIRYIFEKGIVDRDVTVMGWVRSVRKTKRFSFIVLNDGSCQKDLQIIADGDIPNYEIASTMLAGTSVSIKGKLVESQGKGQSVEMQASNVEIIGKVDESYPLQKKATSLEFLRENAHLRSRTNTFGAVFRVRDALSFATHKFFREQGYKYLHTPIITCSDGEGAGEMFRVSNLDPSNLPTDSKGNVDHSQDYFGKETGLAVTGQLEAECFALGMDAVYTFGPTFRSENSNTARHLAEFWMIEPEAAFVDLEGVADLATEYIKYLIDFSLENCKEELEFLSSRKEKDDGEKGHMEMLKHVRDSEFIRISYTEAIDILNNSKEKFEFPTDWGSELQTEHEKYLTDKHFKLPVVVTDYPKGFKAFYMKQNSDGKTVRAMDVLVPGIGEIIGGSQREDNYDALVSRMKEMDMELEDYWWYLDLRKYGSVPHSGFGLGFERAVMYITGMSNIRDVIAFPRTPNNAEF